MCKIKFIQANLGIFTHILALSNKFSNIQESFRHIYAYLDSCVTLAYSEPWYIQNPGIFRTLVYSKPWHIQNPGIIITLAYWEQEAYLETWHIQNQRRIQSPGIFRSIAKLEISTGNRLYTQFSNTNSLPHIGQISRDMSRVTGS